MRTAIGPVQTTKITRVSSAEWQVASWSICYGIHCTAPRFACRSCMFHDSRCSERRPSPSGLRASTILRTWQNSGGDLQEMGCRNGGG
jgi:hypothetical protein